MKDDKMFKALKNEAEIEIFFDEIEPEKNCNYLILGVLFLHTKDKDKILKELLKLRVGGNNSEIHFTEIRKSRASYDKIGTTKNWLNFFINKNYIYSCILYIDLNKLDVSFFGEIGINANIYSKFFRTIINYGLKSFFRAYDKINIKNIFYDRKGELERHSFFNNFNFDKLIYECKKNVELLGKIIFIDSDHKIEKKYPKEANFIQLIDLILGVIRQNIFYLSKDKVKNDISRIIRPELNKLKEEYWSLKYLRVSFFPKNKIKKITDLQKNETYERKDEFYSLEEFELKMPSQSTTLEEWF